MGGPAKEPRAVERGRLVVGAASLALAAIVWSALLWRSHAQSQLPVLFSLPAFSLLDEQGQAFGSSQLAGGPMWPTSSTPPATTPVPC